MPSLKELRRQFRAGAELRKTTGKSDAEASTPAQTSLPGIEPGLKPNVRFSQFLPEADGSDAQMLVGKHRGKLLSEIALIELDYLDWILRSDFPGTLKDIVRAVQSRTQSSGGGGLRHVHDSVRDVLARMLSNAKVSLTETKLTLRGPSGEILLESKLDSPPQPGQVINLQDDTGRVFFTLRVDGSHLRSVCA